MKGKEALASARRREREAIDTAERLRAELAEQKTATTELRRMLVDQQRLEDEIARLRAQIIEGTGDELERVRAENVGLTARVGELDDWRRTSIARWSEILMRLVPDPVERVEILEEIADIYITHEPAEGKLARKYGNEALVRVQRAYRTRSPARDEPRDG